LSGKRWSHRRRRAATLGGIEISLQLVNCLFFIIPNAWVLTHDCSWFDPMVIWSGFVRWSIWNTIFLMYVVQAHSANPANTRRWREALPPVHPGPAWLAACCACAALWLTPPGCARLPLAR
jgi:hypothetical protein